MQKVTIAILDPFIMFRKGLLGLINGFDNCTVLHEVSTEAELAVKFKKGPLPDILLLEIEISGRNGYDIVTWMEQHYPTVKIVVISNIITNYAISKMIVNGVSGFVSKKEFPSLLESVLHKAVIPEYIPGGVHGLLIQKMLPSCFKTAKQYMLIEISDREVAFLQLCCTGLTYKGIADSMKLKETIIKKLSETLISRLGVKNRSELAVFAVDNGLRVVLPFQH